MKAARAIAASLALAAALAVGAALAAGAAAQGTAVPASWDVVGVGRHGLSLKLVYLTGGCLSANADVTVAETAASVTLGVTLQDNEAPGVACPAFARYVTTSVVLASPIAGRAILGRPTPPVSGYSGALVRHGGALDVRVPRLTGLSPADAKHTLALYGLGYRVSPGPRRHGLTRVVSQVPRPGTPAPQRSVVKVRRSRSS